MPRLLLDWLQIHPALGGAAPRVEAHSAQALDAENVALGRPWVPNHDIDVDSINMRMAANPPRSIGDFLALACAEISEDTGLHCQPQEPRPPEPLPNAPAQADAQIPGRAPAPA
jgi:hypothetical protein